MSGHRRWEDVRVHVTKADPGESVAPSHRPPLCCECGKRIRGRQSYDGWGPLGFTPATADVVWHTKCSARRKDND